MQPDKIKNTFVPANDKEIIESVLAGNTALFELLMRRCNSELYKIARCFGFNHQDSEDLMQEAYITAYANLHQFEFRASFKTWISKILINKCQYKRSHGYFGKELPLTDRPDETFVAGVVARKEFSQLLETALQELPVNYRMVFILRAVEGYNVSETAELLGISDINVKVRTNRAKVLLQKKLETLYSATDIYEFHEKYCNRLVIRVLDKISNIPSHLL